jgi:hypothetical protein
MTSRHKRALTAVVVFLAFSFAQVYVLAGLPAPVPGGAPQRLISGRLTTKGGQPITVNGAAAGPGSTILTGATIETPDQVSAVIDLGDAGVIELKPGSKIQLEYDANGNVHVKVLRGCVATKRKTNVLPDATSEIYTDNASEKTSQNRKAMGFCLLPSGGLGALSAGAVGGGLSGVAIGGIVAAGAGGAIAAVALTRGGVVSPARP